MHHIEDARSGPRSHMMPCLIVGGHRNRDADAGDRVEKGPRNAPAAFQIETCAAQAENSKSTFFGGLGGGGPGHTRMCTTIYMVIDRSRGYGLDFFFIFFMISTFRPPTPGSA